MSTAVLFWRRTDVEGLERLELTIEPAGVTAISTVICLEGGGFRLDHRWRLNPEWRAQSVTVERWNSKGYRLLRVERAGEGWRVDGMARPDLEGVQEPDLSVTPFCNTLPIRRMPETLGASLTLDTAFIDGVAMTVTRSRQRYDRVGPRELRYVDLGLSSGFEADLVVDELGLVVRYEHLFERVVEAEGEEACPTKAGS
ncbi:MAG TPA: putative glycolipid-binding domain-containing protein [Bryobacteraceae bacterium]|nr:putative glycolipid-binding domain-containing protein [Bryobacteraceae bacterium]